jgi:hypothetical protein
MKFFARSLKLSAYVRDMQGGLNIIRQEFFKPLTYYFSLVSTSYKWIESVWEIIGWGMGQKKKKKKKKKKKNTSSRWTRWSLRNNWLRFGTSWKLLVIDERDEFEKQAIEVWDFKKLTITIEPDEFGN